jgi:hypothetical protein
MQTSSPWFSASLATCSDFSISRGFSSLEIGIDRIIRANGFTNGMS